MKNFITLFLFLILAGGLVYWLWNGGAQDENVVVQEIYFDQEVDLEAELVETRAVPLARGADENQDLDLNAVEFIVDDRGLVLHKLYGEEVDLIITDNESKDVTVYDGILTYSENVEVDTEKPDKWEFKAVNLDAYIEQYIK